MLWYNAVVPAPTAVQCCGTMLWYQLQQRYNAVVPAPIAVQCCGTMLWYNAVVPAPTAVQFTLSTVRTGSGLIEC